MSASAILGEKRRCRRLLSLNVAERRSLTIRVMADAAFGCPTNEPILVANSGLAVCSPGQRLGGTASAGASGGLVRALADPGPEPLNSPPVSEPQADTRL